MFFQKQRTLIPGFYAHTWRYEAWIKQTQGHQKNLLVCGPVQFFCTHIKNFAIIPASLFKLTRKDSRYKGGPIPKEAMDKFCILKNSLVSKPVMAFPRDDRLLICSYHWCSHWNSRHSWRTRHYPITEGWIWQFLCHLLHLQTVKRSDIV